MRHVDEGTIHAWLDEQITDASEAAWIDEHLRTCAACGARLADERATFERAQALLAGAAPAAARPSFESLVARSGAPADAGTPAAGAQRRAVAGSVWLRAGWAASVVLALGLGWTAREWAGPDSESVLEDAARLELAADGAVGVEPAVPGDVVSSQVAASPPQGDRAEIGDAAVGSAARAATPAANAPAAQQPARIPSTDPGPASPVAPLAQESASASRAPSPPPVGAREPGDAQIAAELPPQSPASPSAPAAARAQAPAAEPPAQEVVLTRPGGSAAVGAVAAPSATGPAAAPGLEWRAAARTEAAVRTGMPLYGIDGLTPVLTSVSSDGAAVRTVYRIETGEVVELVQARGTPAAFRAAVPPAPTVGDLAVQNLVPEARADLLADRAVAAPRALTTVRGGIRIVLSTTAPAANLDALGARLRVD